VPQLAAADGFSPWLDRPRSDAEVAAAQTPATRKRIENWLSPLEETLLFPTVKGAHVDLHNWRLRDWYPALEAAGLAKRGPCALRHTFATEALAAGVSIFELARVMGTSVAMIDRTYGHLARDSEDSIRARLDSRVDRSGVEVASDADGE
jgi:integrase